MVLVIFATNIKPADLVDEAFLRRIHYKVFAESPTVAEFMLIFENCCRRQGAAVRRGSRAAAAPELLPAARDPAARLPAARSHRSGAVAGGLPRASRGSSVATCSRRLRRLLRRRAGVAGSSTPDAAPHASSSTFALALALAALCAAPGGSALAAGATPLTVRITSPLGRPGVPGTDPHRRAGAIGPGDRPAGRRSSSWTACCSSTDSDGPPYAAEWVDANPFEAAGARGCRQGRPAATPRATRCRSSRSRCSKRPR